MTTTRARKVTQLTWTMKTVGYVGRWQRVPLLTHCARRAFPQLYPASPQLPEADEDMHLAVALAWLAEDAANARTVRHCLGQWFFTPAEARTWETALAFAPWPAFRLHYLADRLREIKDSDY